ncbi:hypothetical protein AB0940_34310 [Streptomyces sp. NPDC006656]|uniref:hypothetical protein n=1 Tax=unclassified Streptomyces TaxID=2593676 RepID=UPI0033DD61F4
MPPASLLVIGAAGRPPSLRLDGPHLVLADDAEGENELSGWASDADADALAELEAGEGGASVARLAVPGTAPLAVSGRVRVVPPVRLRRAGPGDLVP